MAQKSTIAAVFLINCQPVGEYPRPEAGPKLAINTDVRVGTSPTVANNALCKRINNGGIYTCDYPLSGNYVGVQKIGTDLFLWGEIRAYEMPPMTLSVSMLSTNKMPNPTLVNALSYSMT